MMNDKRIIHSQILISLRSFIPLLSPDTTDMVAIADTTRTTPSLNNGVISISNKY